MQLDRRGTHQRRPVETPQDRINPREELVRCERLAQIVVGACLEAGDALFGIDFAVNTMTGIVLRRRSWRSPSMPGRCGNMRSRITRS